MTGVEKRAASSLSAIFGLRMLGMFMILPVFALYAEHLDGVTPFLAGLAIGAYGLTQALLQIPFGMLSDRIGRKPVIALGLIIFAIGSVVAAQADTIHGVILGRALQGAGAIAAAIMALLADLTREEHRTKVLAGFGASIGLSFSLALVAGPLLDRWIGVPGIFWLTAVLALGGIAVLFTWVPKPSHNHFHRDAEPVPGQFKRVLSDPQLLRLDLGILTLHMVLTANFVVLPLALHDYAGLDKMHHWWVYLPVLLLGMAVMVPFIIIGEKKRKLKPIFVGAIVTLGLTELLLAEFHHSLWAIAGLLFLFFSAFNLLEATLPSLIAKVAPADAKGTAMGAYSSSQFIGAFTGGALGGWAHGQFGLTGVFILCAGMLAIWAIAAATMAPPRYLSTFTLRVGEQDPAGATELSAKLAALAGVAEAVVIPGDEAAYLKLDREVVNWDELERFSVAEPV
ncbi:MFS transporter [Endothiovibrio diazotrophicus]